MVLDWGLSQARVKNEQIVTANKMFQLRLSRTYVMYNYFFTV